ncbi:MAG: hypothetical protein MJ191_05725 [Clostridium sp.]|nr:hypothetical protein [Clostridium sp.]
MQLDLTMSNLIIIYGFICVVLGLILAVTVSLLDKLDKYIVKKERERKENKDNDKR